MRITTLAIILSCTVTSSSLMAQSPEYLPDWQEGYLDIHNIATGRGDATYVILPDATTMLIDCGEMDDRWGVPQVPDDSRTAATSVAEITITNAAKGIWKPQWENSAAP